MAKPEEKPLPVSSSTPPDFAKAQRELFKEVLELMNRQGIPYVVSGAFALQHHTGIWRDTKDLDLFLVAEDVPRALAALQADGFETEICDPVWLAKAHRDDFFVDLITGMSNAIVTVDRSWIERGSEAEVVGVPARVLGAEELIASKLFVTFRERFDGADIAHVIYSQRGELDWERVLHLVGDHWQIVLWAMMLYNYVYPAHTDYIPKRIWNDLIGRLKSEIEHPNSNAQFRGSLIDEKMFAIDIKEWGMADLLEEHRQKRQYKIVEETREPAA